MHQTSSCFCSSFVEEMKKTLCAKVSFSFASDLDKPKTEFYCEWPKQTRRGIPTLLSTLFHQKQKLTHDPTDLT